MAGVTKKIYMEKPVSSGILFWEVILRKDETLCKTGKVGTRCNENPPNLHPSAEDAQNFVKYLVEQKRKQGFTEVEGRQAKARAVTPVLGLDENLSSDDLSPSKTLPLGERKAKKSHPVNIVAKKQLNGTKSSPHGLAEKHTILKSPGRSFSPISKDGMKTPGKRGRPPKRDNEPPKKSKASKKADDISNDDEPPKKSKASKKADDISKDDEPSKKSKASKKADDISKDDEPPKKSKASKKADDISKDDEPPKKSKASKKADDISKDDEPPKKSKASKKADDISKKADNQSRITKEKVTGKRGRPPKALSQESQEGKDITPNVVAENNENKTNVSPVAKVEHEMERSKNALNSDNEDDLVPSTITPKKVATQQELEAAKKKKTGTKTLTIPKIEPPSPRVSLRDPSKRKMTAKYEMFKQEMIEGRKRRSSEMDYIEDTSTAPKLPTKSPSIYKPGSPAKIPKMIAEGEESYSKDKAVVSSNVSRGKSRLLFQKGLSAGRGKVFKPLSRVTAAKSVAQAKLAAIKPKRGRPSLLKSGSVSILKKTPSGKPRGRPPMTKTSGYDEVSEDSLSKIIVLQKNEGKVVGTPMKRMSAAESAAKQVVETPVKMQAPPPSKLQLTPSRMSTAPVKLLATPSKKEDSPQPVIKRRCVASVNELTIASEFGTVHKPSVDDWPAFIPAPVVWQVPLKKGNVGRNGVSLLVEPDRCLIADDDGCVTEINASAIPTRTWTLPTGVHCMVENRFRIYAGCRDASIYEVSSTPRLLTCLEEFEMLLSIDAYEEYLAVSDQQGKVALLHKKTGEVIWKTKSLGGFGWLVRIDETGVYHGHTEGITKYSLKDGSRLYHVHTDDNVLDGVQNKDFLYVSCGPYVLKIDKVYGSICRTYNKGADHTDLVHSVAVGGGLVYAGGSKIGCYDEVCGELVYCFDLAYSPAAIQYFSGRLFSVGTGLMSVIDFSPKNIEKAMDGEAIDPITVMPVVLPEAQSITATAPAAAPAPEGADKCATDIIKVIKLGMLRQ